MPESSQQCEDAARIRKVVSANTTEGSKRTIHCHEFFVSVCEEVPFEELERTWPPTFAPQP